MAPWGSRVALVAQASSRCPCQRAGSPSPKHYFCPQASAGHRAGFSEAGAGQERSWAAPALRVFAQGEGRLERAPLSPPGAGECWMVVRC